jgi:GTP-binding protein HflX
MKFHSEPIREHAEAPIADDGLLDEIIQNWDRRMATPADSIARTNRCYVVTLGAEADQSAQLAEILSLVRTQGDEIVGHETVKLLKPNPRTLVGSGKAKEIAARALQHGANLLVIDAELSPSQMRNLEDAAGISVSDREAIILNVFLKNAKTRRAKIQVELAHLEYLRPRIRGIGLDMDQQASSIVTGRGPGETASALLARKIDRRIAEHRKALLKIKRSDTVQREGRASCRKVTFVGYTNAGKTSLMNAIAGVSLSVMDRPFETLDTTTRLLTHHGGDVLIGDTVGFIRRLPDRLLASFESTLEGIKESALLLFVVDIADPEKTMHLSTTLNVLAKLGADHVPRLYVFNKVDILDHPPIPEDLKELTQGQPWVVLSSRDQDAVKELRAKILSLVRSDQPVKKVFVPYAATNVFPLIYSQFRVMDSVARDGGVLFSVEGEPHVFALIKKMLSEVCHE